MFIRPGMSPLDTGPDPAREAPDDGADEHGSATGGALPMLGGIDDAWFGGPSDVLSRISSA
jgi:hypothetical protein